MASPVDGVRIYPMFVGTDFSVISIVNSSKTEILRLPMYLLTQSDLETAISSIPYGEELLSYIPVRWHLFYLGGVPRWVTEYILRLGLVIERGRGSSLTAEVIENVFNEIKGAYVEEWGKCLSSLDFIELAAFSVSGKVITLSDKRIHGMTWARVRDSSLCLISPRYDVMIPYAIFHRVANIVLTDDTYNMAVLSFVLCVQELVREVDHRIYDKAPWQLWETFGAYFHALRINSLLIVGLSVVDVRMLFPGA